MSKTFCQNGNQTPQIKGYDSVPSRALTNADGKTTMVRAFSLDGPGIPISEFDDGSLPEEGRAPKSVTKLFGDDGF